MAVAAPSRLERSRVTACSTSVGTSPSAQLLYDNCCRCFLTPPTRTDVAEDVVIHRTCSSRSRLQKLASQSSDTFRQYRSRNSSRAQGVALRSSTDGNCAFRSIRLEQTTDCSKCHPTELACCHPS